jgi:flagellar biosynthesis protein FlhG
MIIAIAGAKGGAGKTLTAANMAIFLATTGKRVVAIDASFGSASLHAFLGVRHSRSSFAECLEGGLATATTEVTAVPGLELISGQTDPLWSANPRPGQLANFIERLQGVDADYVILDLGSGSRTSTLDLFLAADRRILLLAPEPVALELGYRFLRASFLRQLQLTAGMQALDTLDRALFETGVPAPLDLYRAADDELDAKIRAQMSVMVVDLVLNYVRSKAESDMGLAITAAARRRLALPLRYAGPLDHDDAVLFALRRRRPMLIEHPDARISKAIEKVTRRVIADRRDEDVNELLRSPTFYQLFEVEPSASEEEIRRANRRMRTSFDADSPIVSGLYSKAELDVLGEQLDRAYDTLMDPRKRKSYDAELYPEGVPSRVQPVLPTLASAVPPPEERPPMPALTEDTVYGGPVLEQIRLALGLDLRDIAERTKIGYSYLVALEAENYAKLPAPVYVRGFLAEYAKMLGLDGQKVADTYLARWKMAAGT